jgi:hypothetical protein
MMGRQDRDQRQLFYEFRLGLRDFPGECKRFLCGLQAAVRIPRCQSRWLMYARQKTLRGSSSTRWLSARAGLGEPLQSGREVGRLSRYPALLRLTHANKVADHHQPLSDANARIGSTGCIHRPQSAREILMGRTELFVINVKRMIPELQQDTRGCRCYDIARRPGRFWCCQARFSARTLL